MKVYLSIVLDYEGFIRENLYETNSLKEMDDYLRKYNNSKEIRDEYRDIVQEFLLDNRKYLENLDKKAIVEGRNPRNYQGRITICFYGKSKILRFIPMMFHNEKLMNFNKCKRQIRDTLNDDKKLFEFFNEKRYLLSQFEIDSISLYKKFKQERYKKDFIESFIYRLREMDEERRYYYLRSLAHFCSLINSLSVETDYGKIKNIDIPSEPTVLLRDRIVDSCADDFFMGLLEKGDYDRLFKYYDIDDILKYSSDLERPLGLRRK